MMNDRNADGWVREAERLLAAGDGKRAAEAARQAVGLDPQSASAWLTMGTALAQIGSAGVAETCFERALALRPHWPPALSGLGRLWLAAGGADQAAVVFGEALAADEENETLRLQLAQALLSLDRAEEAERHYRLLLENRPSALVFCNLGSVARARGEYRQALTLTEEALRLDPGFAGAHFNRALLLLLQDRLGEGWPEYEWRLQLTPRDRQLSEFFAARGLPRWSGPEADGRRLLVWSEQGLGDAIQFARFLPLLKERDARVILALQPELMRLFGGLAGVDEIVPRQEQPLRAVRADAQLPMMSLPFHLGTETISAGTPYLRADGQRVEWWRNRLARTGWRIGLVWAGGANNPNDRRRSIPLAGFAPLSGITGVQWVSLQCGPAAAQQKNPPPGIEPLDFTPDLADMADTAALISALDLVVTVDTAVAHLAGALGRPVWTLLPFDPDWRWQLERRDTPWYPSMRLFRQPAPGDWPALLNEMAGELKIVTNRSGKA
jgi:tetratricopeptide (TPR) repeat protein